MVINIIFLLAGIFFLVKGSGLFVSSGALIAKKLHVSELVIGLTIIAIGTSLPELVSSILASIKNKGSLVIGTIIGANIADLTLITGVAALINPIKIKKEVLKRDSYMLIFVGVLLALSLIDRVISRIEGLIFLLSFTAYNLFLFYSVKFEKKDRPLKEFFRSFFGLSFLFFHRKKPLLEIEKGKKFDKLSKKFLFKKIALFIFGGLLIYFGAELVISKSILIANSFGVSLFLIGVLISIGTTLPELSVSVASSRKKLGSIAIGNSLGSCITNILLILGIASLISPLVVMNNSIYFSIGILLLVSFITLIFIRTDYEIKRTEGILLLFIYIFFLILLFLGFL